MAYEYRMIQVPPNISIRGVERGQEAAQYLQGVVNEQASQGWEFYRVDELGVEVSPGCLGGLLHTITGGFLGAETTYTYYYVVTFRRETQSPT